MSKRDKLLQYLMWTIVVFTIFLFIVVIIIGHANSQEIGIEKERVNPWAINLI